MKKLRLIYYLVRYMGIRWCLFRVWYALKLKSGWFRWRCPAGSWEEVGAESGERRAAAGGQRSEVGRQKTGDGGQRSGDRGREGKGYLEYRRSADAPKFFFSAEDREKFQPLFAQWDADDSPVEEADAILRGFFRFYSKTEKEVGIPPDWHRNHFTGERAPTDVHWSRLPDFGFGDIKNIWELNRFGWAYTLVRAYWRTGDEKYPEAYWNLFEDWIERNPPNQGVNWKCGQEMSFRLMAWCFALFGFEDARTTTKERIGLLVTAVEASGERIVANIGYAISQKNNHGMSEAMGLWTIGLLFPELKNARSWREKGRKVLEHLATESIYEDGAFSQYSMNYHRVMLDDYVWAIRLGEVNGDRLSENLLQKISVAVKFLWECQDKISGSVPLYGSNDGALILPLTNCDYRDFRPAVTMGRNLTNESLAEASGPWEESVLWLWGAEALNAEGEDENRFARRLTETGYLLLRDADTFVFSRAGSYRHRPSEADLLHVDLWWKGQMIAGDAGSFSYNTAPPFDGAFKRTETHNTVCVDGLDQMEKAGRFLWLPWPEGGWRKVSEQGGEPVFEGWHDGYRRLNDPVDHRRTIFYAGEGAWVVVDRLESLGEHDYVLHWLLGAFPVTKEPELGSFRIVTPKGNYFLAVQTSQPVESLNLSLERGSRDPVRGWRSAYYQKLQEVPSLQLRQRGSKLTFVTTFAPDPILIRTDATGIHVQFKHRNLYVGSDETTLSSTSRNVESSWVESLPREEGAAIGK